MDISKLKSKAPQIIAVIGIIAVAGGVIYFADKEVGSEKVVRGGKYVELAKNHPTGEKFLEYVNKAFDKLEDKDPNNDMEAYLDIGFYENELGDTEGAIAAYKAGIKINSKNELMMSNLGGIYENQKDYANAEKYYKMVVDANPRNVQGIIKLAELYRFYFKDKQQEIISIVEVKGLADNPNNLNLLNFLANYYRYDNAGKDLQKAEINYRRILELDPKNTAIKIELNNLLQQQGRSPLPLD